MKKEDKKTLLITLGVAGLLVLFFLFAPSFEERTKATQAYQQKPKKKEVKDNDFHSVFLSWKERENVLIGKFYFVNNTKDEVTKVTLQCMTFDKNNELLDTFKKRISVSVPKLSNEKVSNLHLGDIDPKTTQAGCKTISYK